MSSLSESEKKLVDAAIRTFVRFGYRKTTMLDIAAEADVSRPTLYASYRSKDEILAASIRYMSERALARAEVALQDCKTLDDKLRAYFEATVVPAFELIESSPESNDLITGHNAAGKAAILEMQVKRRNVIMQLLAPHQAEIERSGQSLSQFAHFVIITSTGMKYAADSKEELLDLLASLRIAILKVAGDQSSGT